MVKIVDGGMKAKDVAFESVNHIDDTKPDDEFFNITRYAGLADRTVSDQFFGDDIPARLVLNAVGEAKLTGEYVDQLKRALFYGKTHEDVAFAAKLHPPGGYGDVSPDLIHAILGIYTEAAELMELLGELLINPDADLSGRLIDESGDVMWYQALLFKVLGTDFEKVGEKNIAKLKVRYPVKFEMDEAVNRDEAKESTVFQ